MRTNLHPITENHLLELHTWNTATPHQYIPTFFFDMISTWLHIQRPYSIHVCVSPSPIFKINSFFAHPFTHRNIRHGEKHVVIPVNCLPRFGIRPTANRWLLALRTITLNFFYSFRQHSNFLSHSNASYIAPHDKAIAAARVSFKRCQIRHHFHHTLWVWWRGGRCLSLSPK